MELKNDWWNMRGQIWSNLQTVYVCVCVCVCVCVYVYVYVCVCVTDLSLCTRCAGVFRQEDIVLPALSALLPDHKSCERRCLHFSVWWVLSLSLYFLVKPRPFSLFQATNGSGWGSRLNVWPVLHPINPAVLPPHYQNPCCHHNESLTSTREGFLKWSD